jgi:hypothetical protein
MVFAIVEPTTHAVPEPEPARTRSSWLRRALPAFFLVAALLTVALVQSLWLRVTLPLALVATTLLLARRRRAPAARPGDSRASGAGAALRRSGKRPVPDARSVILETDASAGSGPRVCVRSDVAGDLAALELSTSFGIVLLSNRRRDRLVAALTSEVGTLLIGTRLDLEARLALSDLLAASSVHVGDDGALDATGPDGRPICLSPDSFRALVRALVELDGSAEGRMVLSDQRGDSIRLEGNDLLVRGVHFDLTRPVEWKPIMFQEQFGQAFTLFYQGTCVRQGANEVVLVSLLTPAMLDLSLELRSPVSVRPPSTEPRLAALDGMAVRDQRLMQQSAGDPPPIDQRVAIDGLFVVPIRAALDQAPRASSPRPRTSYA